MNCHTDNSIHIAADVELVWDLTNDLGRWTGLFTEYASVEVLEHHDRTFRFRLTMHPDDAGNAWSWVSERTLDPENHRVSARRVELGWFEYMHISWTYHAEGSGTRMRWVQDFAMNAQSPVDGTQMTGRINTNTIIQMAHMRDEVERLALSLANTGMQS